MASPEDESGLFAIDIDIDTPPPNSKLPRDHQSEEAFLEVKNTWKAKVETGAVITTPKSSDYVGVLCAMEKKLIRKCLDRNKTQTTYREPDQAGISEHHACN